MRRPHAARSPSARQRLAFESLEPRDMLAADAGLDWSFAWDAATYDDWSWTFNDDWSSTDAGDASGDNAWWVGDLPWDQPAGGEEGIATDAYPDESPAPAPTDEVAPPADVVDVTDHPAGPEVVADDPPPPTWETAGPEPAVPTASGDAEVTGTESPASVESVADEQPVTATPGPDVDETPVDETAVDETPVDETPVDETPVDETPVDETPVDETTYDTADTEQALTLPDPADDAGVVREDESSAPHAGPTAIDDEAVFELPVFEPPVADTAEHDQQVTAPEGDPPTDSGDVGIADAPQPAPVAAPSLPAPVSTAPMPSHDGVASRFRSWGGFLFQMPGRPAGSPDGVSAAVLADGQPGSSRSRIRLPFRPFS